MIDTISAPKSPEETEPISEIKQISVASDSDIEAVNALLSEGWRLLHIGHVTECTVYVLGKKTQPSRRRAGFLP